jgi:hypothetical protein
LQRRAASPRLYSIAGLLKERDFHGTFSAGGSNFNFVYAPVRSEIAGQRLLLEGELEVINERGVSRKRRRVRALLASIQGGIGAAPMRPPVNTSLSAPSNPATAPGQPPSTSNALPVTESTGGLSFTGVMYFQFEPVDERALGVPADMSRLQLNARLAPSDGSARTLHGIYSAIVDALYGEKIDDASSKAYVAELNRLLAAKTQN